MAVPANSPVETHLLLTCQVCAESAEDLVAWNADEKKHFLCHYCFWLASTIELQKVLHREGKTMRPEMTEVLHKEALRVAVLQQLSPTLS